MSQGLTVQIRGYISAASADYPNVSVSFLKTMAAFETGVTFNTEAVSPTQAKGLFQFTRSTAKAYNLQDPFDAKSSTFAAAHLAQENYDFLANSISHIIDAQLYLAHQEGASGARYILNKPSTFVSNLPPKIRQNVMNNGGSLGMTAQQFVDKKHR